MNLNYTEFLRKVPFFETLTEQDCKVLAKLVVERDITSQTQLFSRGSPGDALYIVVEGEVEIYVRKQNGEKIILSIASTGDFLGELSLLESGPRNASALAVTPTKVLVLDQEHFIEFLQTRPLLMLELIKIVIGRLRRTTEIMQEHTAKNSNQVIQRKFTLLQRLTSRGAELCGSVGFFIINIIVFSIWIIPNLGFIDGFEIFDPYPFYGLSFFVALEAIFLSIIVLCAQNLQAASNRIRNDTEYQANLNAELGVLHLHTRIGNLHEEVISRLHKLEKLMHKSR